MPLQRAARDRCRLTSIEHTGLLAQDFGRAGARAGAAEDVGRQDGARRAVEIVGADLMDETWDVDAGGAGTPARRVIAVQAALGLDLGLGRAQRRVQVGEIVRELCLARAPSTARLVKLPPPLL